MELMDIVNLFDTNGFNRKVVSSPHHSKILSFDKETTFTVTVNETTFNETNKVCLASTDNTINLYVNNFTLTNYTKIDIKTISTIVITWNPKKMFIVDVLTEDTA